MGIALETTGLIQIANLLRDDILLCRMVLEENPLDIDANTSINISKTILVKITLAGLDPEGKDDYKHKIAKSIVLSDRRPLN